MKHLRHTTRGVSLVEAMVALAVMAFGMLAVVGIQATMRLNADIAKQRSEATRFAQTELETQRAFSVIDADGVQLAYADIETKPSRDEAGVNATYQVKQQVLTYTNPPAKTLVVTVEWQDRTGQKQQVLLNGVITAAAPALSGTLAVRPGTAAVAPVRRPYRRHPSIPVLARDFGTTSAWVPPFRTGMALVFNNVSGLITGVCDFGYSNSSNETISAVDIQNCSNNTLAQLLSGFVRYNRTTTGPDLTAADVEDPPGPALRLLMQLNLTSSGHPNGSFCVDDADRFTTANGALPLASYFCVIRSNAEGLWSGSTEVEPLTTFNGVTPLNWEIDSSPSSVSIQRFRVCRYTTAANDSQFVPNQEHPRNYVDVLGNLTNQNFVVISSSMSCPTDTAANTAAGDLVNSNTLQHQPNPI